METRNETLGIIGLGKMGEGMATNLIKAGFTVMGYDLNAEALDRLVAQGGQRAESSREVAESCGTVLTCLEGKVTIAVTRESLLPHARPGQTYIDLSTVPAPVTRELGAAFLAKGCRYLDAPVSGGPPAANSGTLRIFIGGDAGTIADCRPLFEAIGKPEKTVHCGSIGMGQSGKVVQQLTHRFPDVARMEVMAFGIRSGLDLETVMRALDVEPGANDPYAALFASIRDGETDDLSGLYSEWDYYLQEVKAQGFRMPMLEAMHAFCRGADTPATDGQGRAMPSIWNELMRYRDGKEEPGTELKP